MMIVKSIVHLVLLIFLNVSVEAYVDNVFTPDFKPKLTKVYKFFEWNYIPGFKIFLVEKCTIQSSAAQGM